MLRSRGRKFWKGRMFYLRFRNLGPNHNLFAELIKRNVPMGIEDSD